MENNLAEKRGVQLLMDIANVATESLKEFGVDDKKAREIGLEVADMIRQTYGGEQPYIPKGIALIIGKKYREFYSKFNGDNLAVLCKEHGFTLRHGYNIIARIRDEEFRSRQLGLFGGQDNNC